MENVTHFEDWHDLPHECSAHNIAESLMVKLSSIALTPKNLDTPPIAVEQNRVSSRGTETTPSSIR